jgi:hypothetical protein
MITSVSMTRRLCSALTLVVLSLSFVARVSAQFDTATVLGTVRDQNGSIVEGANVTLKNLATGISSTATTDANGDFQFVNTKICSTVHRSNQVGVSS